MKTKHFNKIITFVPNQAFYSVHITVTKNETAHVNCLSFNLNLVIMFCINM